MNLWKRAQLVIVIILVSITSAFAQREKNSIFIFDCTGSMNQKGLWDPAKTLLESTITELEKIPGSQFVVIPFGTNPGEPITFSTLEEKKSEIFKTLDADNKDAMRLHTNISAALEAGFGKVDKNKENDIYLFTDGEPDGEDTPEKVAETINKWCSNHKNCTLFYVSFKDKVKPTIHKAINDCSDAYLVDIMDVPHVAVKINTNDVYTNLQELSKPIMVDFGLSGTHKVKAVSNNEFLTVNVKNGEAKDGKIFLQISTKRGVDSIKLRDELHGTDYSFPITIECEDKLYQILNPDVIVHVSDVIPVKLTLGKNEKEIVAAGAKWYDSFLWSPEAQPQKVEWDLAPVFENQMSDSRMDLKFQPSEGMNNDFKAWYNEKPLKAGETITILPGQPAKLSVLFNKDAQTGKRYFNLEPIGSSSLEMVNGQPVDQYEGTSLRTEYNVGWNPLATLLFWIGIILLGLLILWLLILRPVFYPAIRVNKIEMMGPNSYFKYKRIKGARKIVLSSKKKQQNIISRIFTGEVRYERAEHFVPEIIIVPGLRETVKVKSEGEPSKGWDIYPSSSFRSYEKGKLKNKKTNQEFEIEFS